MNSHTNFLAMTAHQGCLDNLEQALGIRLDVTVQPTLEAIVNAAYTQSFGSGCTNRAKESIRNKGLFSGSFKKVALVLEGPDGKMIQAYLFLGYPVADALKQIYAVRTESDTLFYLDGVLQARIPSFTPDTLFSVVTEQSNYAVKTLWGCLQRFMPTKGSSLYESGLERDTVNLIRVLYC